jgi:GntR family transcriptional repressor for pyruvate dehydrogenase complex
MSGGSSGPTLPAEAPVTSPSETARAPREVGAPVERHHASDQVFRELASAILNRELSPDSPLPPERELSDRFGVSRIVVREAIHRLKEYELVRVRQGSPTMVLDPDHSTDIRLLGLEIDLVPPTPAGVGAFAERQVYSAASLLDLSEQRMSSEEIDAIEKLVSDFLALNDKDAESLRFERAYWTAIANGTKNRIYLRETLWYFNLIERDPRLRATLTGDSMARALLYRQLLVTQRARSGSAATYLAALRSVGFRAD